jgi:hypothetical protein
VGVAQAQAESSRLGHWTERLPGGSLPHAPVWLWIGVTGAILLCYLGAQAIFGDLQASLQGGPEDDPGEFERTVILAVLTGFLVSTSRWAADGSRRDLERLRPFLQCSPGEFDSFVRGLYKHDRTRTWLCVGVAILVGLLMIPLTMQQGGLFLQAESWYPGLWFAIVLNLALFSVMGRELWATVEVTDIFTSLEGHLGKLDLLEPKALSPFADRGLRSAVFWIGGSCIASLLFLQPGALPTLGVVAVTVAIGTAALILPTRAVHRRLRVEKQAELARVRAVIREERESLLEKDSTGAAESSATRLPGLLAYEARIAGASAWPFDAPILVRFALLLALALGSWVGGALVERFLSTVLG